MSLIGCSRVLENKILIDPATTEGSLSWKIPKFCENLKINSNLLFVTEDMKNKHLKLLWMAWKRQCFCWIFELWNLYPKSLGIQTEVNFTWTLPSVQTKLFSIIFTSIIVYWQQANNTNIGRVQWNKLFQIIWRKLPMIDELFNAKTAQASLVKFFISLVWLLLL